MSDQPIGVAIAGLGFGEAVHLPALRANADLNPVALWHPRKERLDEASAKQGLPGHDNWDALLEDPSVEAVIIATPPAPGLISPAELLRPASTFFWRNRSPSVLIKPSNCRGLPLKKAYPLVWITSTAPCRCSCKLLACSLPVRWGLLGW